MRKLSGIVSMTVYQPLVWGISKYFGGWPTILRKLNFLVFFLVIFWNLFYWLIFTPWFFLLTIFLWVEGVFVLLSLSSWLWSLNLIIVWDEILMSLLLWKAIHHIFVYIVVYSFYSFTSLMGTLSYGLLIYRVQTFWLHVHHECTPLYMHHNLH